MGWLLISVASNANSAQTPYHPIYTVFQLKIWQIGDRGRKSLFDGYSEVVCALSVSTMFNTNAKVHSISRIAPTIRGE